MTTRIFFCPIGNTDPIRNDYDGPMLHIVRYYHPEKIYLFLTAEMARRDEDDNIYEWTLKQLAPDIEVIKLYHKDITEPQTMEPFDRAYPAELQKIHEKNKDSEIIANVSSGTPQMIASLHVFAASSAFPIRLIAVNTPENAVNSSKNVGNHYNKEQGWANDIDNESDKDIKNRCVEIHRDNIKKAIIKNIIEKYVTVYDYAAAITVINDAEDFFDEKLLLLLKGANHRIHLEHSQAIKCFQNADLYDKDIYPVQSSDCLDIFEYILRLQKFAARKQLLELAQGFSPLLLELSYMSLKRVLKIDMNTYIKTTKKGKFFVEYKLPVKYKNILEENFHNKPNYNSPIKAASLIPIIEYEAINQHKTNISEKIKGLREVEKKVRNMAAHEITAISEETFAAKTNMTSTEIIKSIRELYQKILGGYTDWDSYDKMNEKIRIYLK